MLQVQLGHEITRMEEVPSAKHDTSKRYPHQLLSDPSGCVCLAYQSNQLASSVEQPGDSTVLLYVSRGVIYTVTVIRGKDCKTL
jgi:hypothetical protein